MNNNYYEKHVFFCINQKEAGKRCCNASGGSEACEYVKQRIADLNLRGPGKIRVSSSGCMGRCGEGPVMVVYPEGVWYTFSSTEDLDRIINEHLIQNKIVSDLMI